MVLLSSLFLCSVTVIGAAYQPKRVYEATECYRDDSKTNYFHSYKHESLEGDVIDFEKYRGQVSLVVNVASF